MASVYQRQGSPFWMARFKSPAGEWMAKTTKQKSRTKALEIAHLWESGGKLLMLENPQHVQFEKVLRGMYEQITGKRLDPNPAGEWLRKWAATQSAQKAAKTGTRYAKVIDDFVKHLGAQAAELDIRTISQSSVQEFIDAEKRAGKSSTTVILNAKILRAAFNAAVRSGAIERNPAGVLDLPANTQQHREPFTAKEVSALLRAARGSDWEAAIMLGRHVGMRIGDATNLEKASIDFAARLISFVPQKTARKGKKLVVPMTAELEQFFRQRFARRGSKSSTKVCPTLAGREVGGRAGLSQEFLELMRNAGVDSAQIKSKGGVGRAFSAKSFHSLRHTIASDLANANAPEKIARDILGHASAAMTDRYTHLETETMRSALENAHRASIERG